MINKIIIFVNYNNKRLKILIIRGWKNYFGNSLAFSYSKATVCWLVLYVELMIQQMNLVDLLPWNLLMKLYEHVKGFMFIQVTFTLLNFEHKRLLSSHNLLCNYNLGKDQSILNTFKLFTRPTPFVSKSLHCDSFFV